MEDFNLRNYLYNNPLLEEEKEDKKDIKSKGKKKDVKSKDKKKDVKEDKLREYIRGKITSILQEEKEDVNVEDEESVDVDVKKDVDIEDTEEEDITIDDEESEVETDIDVKMPGDLDPAVEMIQGLLTKAQQEAEKLGDPKLLDQIGNTITFFTRKHVVKGGLTELRKNKK